MKVQPISKKCFMSPMHNQDNLKQLHDIHSLFPLEGHSRARFENHLLSIAETGRSTEPEFNHSLQYFNNMGSDLREWYKLKKESKEDKRFQSFQRDLFQLWHKVQDKLPSETIGQMLNYDCFLANKVIHEGQSQKIFKLLVKKGIMSAEQIPYYTQSKDGETQQYLCLSRNPIDYFMSSTNQSFGSCLNMTSEHYEAFYLGLLTEMLDPNKFLAFTTYGKTTKYSLETAKGNKVFKHFRYISRSWMIINSDWTVGQVRSYPDVDKCDFNSMLAQANYLRWSKNYASKQHDRIKSTTDTFRGVARPPKSPYWFQPLLDWMNLKPCHTYSDWGMIRLNKRSQKRFGVHKWLKNNPYIIKNRIGSSTYGGSSPQFNIQSGFSSLPEDTNNRIALIYGQKKYCTVCKQVHPKNEVRKFESYKHICEDCLAKISFYCTHCKRTRETKNKTKVMVFERDLSGQVEIKEKTMCNDCARRTSKECTECGERHTKRYSIYDRNGAYSDHICHTCLTTDNEEKFLKCERGCGHRFRDGEGLEADDRVICRSCFDQYYFYCVDCEEVSHEEDSIYIEDHGRVCETCREDYNYCPRCSEYSHRDSY